MKNLARLIVVVTMLLTLLVVAIPVQASGPEERILYAGQHIPVGKVVVSDDGTTLNVVYEITELGWCITTTHLYVGTKPPKKAISGFQPSSSTIFTLKPV